MNVPKDKWISATLWCAKKCVKGKHHCLKGAVKRWHIPASPRGDNLPGLGGGSVTFPSPSPSSPHLLPHPLHFRHPPPPIYLLLHLLQPTFPPPPIHLFLHPPPPYLHLLDPFTRLSPISSTSSINSPPSHSPTLPYLHLLHPSISTATIYCNAGGAEEDEGGDAQR